MAERKPPRRLQRSEERTRWNMPAPEREHNTVQLTDREVLWLLGHTAYEDGVGRDIYEKVRSLPVQRPKAQLPLEVR